MVAMTELVAIGKVVKPFGVKGDVRVQSLSDVPGRFESLGEVTLVAPSGRSLVTRVQHVRKDRDSYVMGLEAFSSPEEAALFRGALIQIPHDQVPTLPDGQYYEFQLIGMAVVTERQEPLGTLEEIMPTPSHPVFVVRGEGRERLIPGTRSMVIEVDVERRRMTVRWPGVEGEPDAQ
ncbi:ribosome maturation factor RimM [Candidatus Nitrospira bockiana]